MLRLYGPSHLLSQTLLSLYSLGSRDRGILFSLSMILKAEALISHLLLTLRTMEVSILLLPSFHQAIFNTSNFLVGLEESVISPNTLS